jgi:hypothetical protein
MWFPPPLQLLALFVRWLIRMASPELPGELYIDSELIFGGVRKRAAWNPFILLSLKFTKLII